MGRMIRRSESKTGELPAAGENPNGSFFAERLRKAEGLQELFGLAKEIAWKFLKVEQAGLMVGLAELGIGSGNVLGAYYSPDANTIVLNRTVMDYVSKLSDAEFHKSYCLYLLLHEYLHSCGLYDERQNRQIVAAIAVQAFDGQHPVAKLATGSGVMLKAVQKHYLQNNPGAAAASPEIEFVTGIDRSNTNYIS